MEDVAEDPTNDKKFTGSWYFTPTEPMVWYVRTTTDGVTTYEAETLFTRFGHWLTDPNDDGNIMVNTYAMTDAPAATLNVTTVNTDADATMLTDTSATYTGTAAGMSFHQEVDGDAVLVPGTLQSGAFTADVTLTAKFGGSPTLGGYINGFEGNAVDPNWRVTLVDGAFADATLLEGTDDSLRSER